MKILKRRKFIFCGDEWELQLRIGDDSYGRYIPRECLMALSDGAAKDGSLLHELIECAACLHGCEWVPGVNNREEKLIVMNHQQMTNVVDAAYAAMIQIHPALKRGVVIK